MSNIYTLPVEIICHILSFLSDPDKLSFISCSKSLRELASSLRFDSLVDFDLIKNLSYFDRFTKVRYQRPVVEFKLPSCIKEIHMSSYGLIPKNAIKVQKVVIESLDRKDIQTLSNALHTQPSSLIAQLKDIFLCGCLTPVDLGHIHCKEMVIADNRTFSTISFSEGIEKLTIGEINATSYLILPDSLKSLWSYGDIVIKRMSRNLEELVCRELVNTKTPFELPKSLSVFRVDRIRDVKVRNVLLSCYRSLKLKSLSIALDIGLDFKYLESLEDLILQVNGAHEKISCFPPRLKNLHIICTEYSEMLPKLPDTLKKFSFNVERVYEIPLPEFPLGLEILELRGYFSERINFPENIRKLVLFGYSHQIDFSKLRNLKILILGGSYSHDLTGLCDGLEELVMFETSSESYNKNIILPNTLRKVQFPNSFNREIALPESLEEIVFGRDFNQKITLPSKAVRIVFGECFNQEVELPDSLQEISFGKEFNIGKLLTKKFPPNLKYVRSGRNIVLCRKAKRWEIMVI